MANLTALITTMKNAQRGADVRDAIADTLAAVNVDNLAIIQKEALHDAKFIELTEGAVNALASADNAADSEGVATTQAGIATTKATEAAASKAAAETAKAAAELAKTASETARAAAQLAETNAETSETNSKASEIASEASETSATGSAGTATTKAGEASASAAAALVSADNAGDSEVVAAAKAVIATDKAAEALAAKNAAETAQGIAVQAKNAAELAGTTNLTELADARRGQVSLGTKIDLIDSQLADISRKGKNVKEFGVRIYDNQSSVTLERILDSVGMVANAAVGTGSVVNDFDNEKLWPRRRTVNGYYDETAKKFMVTAVKGEPTFKSDGTNGNVWVETERFYVKRTVGAGFIDWSICKEQLPGYYTFPKFKGLDNEELEFGYACAYEVGTDGSGNPISWSGVNPTNVSHDSGLVLARKLGTRYHMDDTTDIELVRLMMMIEFAKTDSQASIGNGIMSLSHERTTCLATVTETAVNRVVLANAEADLYVVGQTIVIGTAKSLSDIANLRKVTSITVVDASNKALNFDETAVNITIGNFVTSRMTRTGETDAITASSGTLVNDGKHAVVYRGTENPFGNGFKVVSDVVFKNEDSQIYICSDPRKRMTGMSVLTADYKPIGYTLATVVEGYAKTLGCDPNYPSARFTTVVGGSSTTFLADYFYRNVVATTGLREVLNGGVFAGGTGVGSCSWNLNHSLGASWVLFAGRLSFTG